MQRRDFLQGLALTAAWLGVPSSRVFAQTADGLPGDGMLLFYNQHQNTTRSAAQQAAYWKQAQIVQGAAWYAATGYEDFRAMGLEIQRGRLAPLTLDEPIEPLLARGIIDAKTSLLKTRTLQNAHDLEMLYTIHTDFNDAYLGLGGKLVEHLGGPWAARINSGIGYSLEAMAAYQADEADRAIWSHVQERQELIDLIRLHNEQTELLPEGTILVPDDAEQEEFFDLMGSVPTGEARRGIASLPIQGASSTGTKIAADAHAPMVKAFTKRAREIQLSPRATAGDLEALRVTHKFLRTFTGLLPLKGKDAAVTNWALDTGLNLATRALTGAALGPTGWLSMGMGLLDALGVGRKDPGPSAIEMLARQQSEMHREVMGALKVIQAQLRTVSDQLGTIEQNQHRMIRRLDAILGAVGEAQTLILGEVEALQRQRAAADRYARAITTDDYDVKARDALARLHEIHGERIGYQKRTSSPTPERVRGYLRRYRREVREDLRTLEDYLLRKLPTTLYTGRNNDARGEALAEWVLQTTQEERGPVSLHPRIGMVEILTSAPSHSVPRLESFGYVGRETAGYLLLFADLVENPAFAVGRIKKRAEESRDYLRGICAPSRLEETNRAHGMELERACKQVDESLARYMRANVEPKLKGTPFRLQPDGWQTEHGAPYFDYNPVGPFDRPKANDAVLKGKPGTSRLGLTRRCFVLERSEGGSADTSCGDPKRWWDTSCNQITELVGLFGDPDSPLTKVELETKTPIQWAAELGAFRVETLGEADRGNKSYWDLDHPVYGKLYRLVFDADTGRAPSLAWLDGYQVNISDTVHASIFSRWESGDEWFLATDRHYRVLSPDGWFISKSRYYWDRKHELEGTDRPFSWFERLKTHLAQRSIHPGTVLTDHASSSFAAFIHFIIHQQLAGMRSLAISSVVDSLQTRPELDEEGVRLLLLTQLHRTMQQGASSEPFVAIPDAGLYTSLDLKRWLRAQGEVAVPTDEQMQEWFMAWLERRATAQPKPAESTQPSEPQWSTGPSWGDLDDAPPATSAAYVQELAARLADASEETSKLAMRGVSELPEGACEPHLASVIRACRAFEELLNEDRHP